MTLELLSIEVFYRNARALHPFELRVEPGEIVALIGANGAGKTTLLRTVSGLIVPRSGRILFHGADLVGRACHEIVALGIGHVPEGRCIFGGLSVRENLELGAFLVSERRALLQRLECVLTLFPALGPRLDLSARTLSGGELQMLAIARALMSRPRLLLLDEPSLGIAPLLVRQIFSEIARINRENGTAILLVDQNARAALHLASRGYVLQNGRVVREGTAVDLRSDPRVVDAYLGGRSSSARDGHAGTREADDGE